MEQITSRSNPLIAHLRKLGRDRGYRRETGQFLCEGPKMLAEALRWGGSVQAVIADGPLETELPDSARRVQVPSDLLRSVAPTQTPQHLLFLCQIPQLTPPDRLSGCQYLVLDGVQDPGNVGTLWRTADAFGADGVFLLNGCADPFGPKTVRATMGACFRLPLWEGSLDELMTRLEDASLPLIATALQADTEDIRSGGLERAAVVIGSEGQGVSPQVLACSEKTIQIPMTSRCESLNAAVAGAVVLWEMWRGKTSSR